MARMDHNRLLVITQDGCKRHHIRFTLLLDPSIVRQETDFWVEEVGVMFYKVYFERPEADQLSQQFDRAFREKIEVYGLNRRFNFPLGTRTFICELLYDETKGARVSVEMVNFIFKEEVANRRKGIPSDQDDGWEKNDK